MSSAYKTSKAELVAIYRLEFYKQKKNWKFCKDVLKGKDSKEKESKETAPAKNSGADYKKPSKNLLDETYVVDKPAQGLDDAFLESESDTNLAKDSTPQTKEEPKGWTNSSRNIALTSILQSEACREAEQLLPGLQDVTDGPVWSEPQQEPRPRTSAKDVKPMRVWSEELEWQESGQERVFQPELWSPTRESPICFSPDKVWSKEDQIWPQSPESWPEPILWRDNELVWPVAGQQADVDDADLIWPPAKHQQSKGVDETELLWSPASQQSQKAVWPDDSQQARNPGLPQWPPDSKGGGQRWEALRGWIEGLPQELEAPLSPEVLVTTAEEWLHEPLVDRDRDDWLDDCAHACLSRSMCEFMRGAHLRHHSSETQLAPESGAAAGAAGLAGAPGVGALSQAALGARVRRHAQALKTLLGEARVRQRLSAELEDFAYRPHESNSYEEFPTRDVGLQGIRAVPQGIRTVPQGIRIPPQGTGQDNFISGSFLNDPCFDLGGGSDNGRPHGRGRGRLAHGSEERVIGIGPGGRPYRL